jgi:hypothetical protein
MSDDVTALRRRLRAKGFAPIPVSGKIPALEGWQLKHDTNDAEIGLCAKLYPYSQNTGMLTRLVPTLDIDILNPEAAAAVEGLARERLDERSYLPVRFGRSPKRALPFRTDEPFKKIGVALIAADGDKTQKLELLCDGQQLVVAGIHPGTLKPYGWHGPQPGEIAREELAYIVEAEARALEEDAAELLVREYGYRKQVAKPRKKKANGPAAEATDWRSFNVIEHADLASYAMSLQRRRQIPALGGGGHRMRRCQKEATASQGNSRHRRNRPGQDRSRAGAKTGTGAASDAAPGDRGVRQMARPPQPHADLCLARRRRRQPAARRSGLARHHRAAVQRQDGDSQFAIAPAPCRADRDPDPAALLSGTPKRFFPHLTACRDRMIKARSRFVHYTSAENALKIITSKHIWMRNATCMVDYREVRHGFVALQRYFTVHRPTFDAALNECSPGIAEEAFGLFDQWWQNIQLQTYITSISKHDERENLHSRFSMWRAFGHTTARVAIVVKLPLAVGENEGFSPTLSPVMYFSDQDIVGEFGSVISNVSENREFLRGIDRNHLLRIIFLMFVTAIVTLKHEGFHEEKEWRIIYSPKRSAPAHIESSIEVVGGIPQLVYKIPFKNDPDAGISGMDPTELLDRIIIGPTQFPWAMYEAFVAALEGVGVTDAASRVHVSQIPIRT